MPSLAELASAARKAIPNAAPGPAAASLRSRALWQEVFGRSGVTKEDPRPGVRPGGDWTRSTVSSSNALKRLLEAMRSNAPGGWSDDRWTETRNLVSIAFVAITAKCRVLSQSEFQVYRKDRNSQDGKIPIFEDDPAYDLVRVLEKPNPQDSFGSMMWRWQQQQDLTGSALTWMVPNRLGRPMELYSIPTAMAVPMPQSHPDLPEGGYRIQPVYPYGPFSSYPTPLSAVGALVPGQWMLRFVYPHPFLRYEGYSPLTGLRLEMDELNMINRSRHSSMRKAVNPSAVVDMSEMEEAQPWLDSELDRMRVEFENVFYGPENAGGIIAPPPGCKVEPWGANPVDMDYPTGWEQLTNFIMAGFGITKPAAGMVEDSSYATLFATLKQLDLLTLQPYRDDIASKLTRYLAPFFGDDLIIEIRGKRIDDHDVKANKLSQLIQAKAITKNELRRELEMPLTKEEWGDEVVGMEQQQGAGMPGMEGATPGGGDNPLAELAKAAGGGGEGGESGEPSEPSEPSEPGEYRSGGTGGLGDGSRGPRDHLGKPSLPKSLARRMKSLRAAKTKSLPSVQTKSMYDLAIEVCSNGH